MATMIRCPDFPLTNALHAHLARHFGQALRKYRDHISQVEVSIRSLRQDPYQGDDVHVHVNIELDGMESFVITAVSHDEYVAASIAARRTRRAVKRAIRRHERIEQYGLRTLAYHPSRLTFEGS